MKKIILITILVSLAIPVISIANGNDEDHHGMMNDWNIMGFGMGWFGWIFAVLVLIVLILVIIILIKQIIK